MKKRLVEYIADADAEHKLCICSVVDIHTESMLNAIKHALLKYDCRDVKPGTVSSFQNNPEGFPNIGLAQVYKVEAVVGIKPQMIDSLKQEIALGTIVPASLFKVMHPDAPTPKADTKPEPILGTAIGDASSDKDTEVKGTQDLVGQSRIFKLLDELASEAKKEAEKKADDVKKFVITHLGLKELVGESRVRGYYVCSTDGDKVNVLEGPFNTKPDGMKIITNEAELRTAKSVLRG